MVLILPTIFCLNFPCSKSATSSISWFHNHPYWVPSKCVRALAKPVVSGSLMFSYHFFRYKSYIAYLFKLQAACLFPSLVPFLLKNFGKIVKKPVLFFPASLAASYRSLWRPQKSSADGFPFHSTSREAGLCGLCSADTL